MMFYGLCDIAEAFKICKAVCDVLGYGSNNNAHYLLMETAQQETHLGRFKDLSVYGAGVGVCQFDKIAFDDVKQRTRIDVIEKIERNFGVNWSELQHRDLAFSPFLSFLFCRLFYRLIPSPIPLSVNDRALYWKKYYNTALGSGTALQYVENAKKILIGI